MIKKRWKSLRDNFRAELKKVPAGTSADAALPIDQYLSKWPYFKMMFFLKDSMKGRPLTSNLTRAPTLQESETEACSPAPSQVFEHSEPKVEILESPRSRQRLTAENEAESGPSSPEQDGRGPANKRKRDSSESGSLLEIERERLEVEKQKLQLLIEDVRRRQSEENDADRHFLLSLLPILRQVPMREKFQVQVCIQETLREALCQGEKVVILPQAE